jgi:hypothetical protein
VPTWARWHDYKLFAVSNHATGHSARYSLISTNLKSES